MTEARVVARQELRDLWLGGRGLPLLLAYSIMLSVTSYLVASNKALNFLEQREAVSLTLQLAVAISALLVLLASADAISGERERGTLESLLLTPAPRAALVVGKAIAAMSLWAAAYAVSVPYLWYLGRGSQVTGKALGAGLLVGFLVAAFLCGLGLTLSALARSNRLALSVSLFVLLAAFFPTQLPTNAQHGWVGDALFRFDPITAGLHYLGELIVKDHAVTQDASWLVGPVAFAVVASVAALTAGARMRLLSGSRS
jgi:ABC-2 type transport system permease protein